MRAAGWLSMLCVSECGSFDDSIDGARNDEGGAYIVRVRSMTPQVSRMATPVSIPLSPQLEPRDDDLSECVTTIDM
jgi:hypothetical protein